LISIIIPTFNEQDNIVNLLQSIYNGIAQDLEVIVVDGGSADQTVDRVAGYKQVKLIKSDKCRAIQMNTGARLSTYDVLFFVHADSQLPPGWFTSISNAIAYDDCVAGSFYLKFNKDGFWYRLYSRLSKIQHPLFTFGDQGLFVSKHTFEQVGGYPEIPILEDYELITRLNKQGPVVKLPTALTTSSRKFSKNGVVIQQLKNVAIVLCYLAGVSPARLANWYG
jgi:rSAM/selenodomain-associated transferase 2